MSAAAVLLFGTLALFGSVLVLLAVLDVDECAGTINGCHDYEEDTSGVWHCAGCGRARPSSTAE
jgi:hypothetical protein